MNVATAKAQDGFRLERGRDGQLWLTSGSEAHVVSISRCFPWSARAQFISLRDRDQRELWLIEDPRTLDARSRETLEDALVETDFVLEIETVEKIDEEVEIRCWNVQTTQGPRQFQTRRDDWPRIVPGGGVLIRDVAGDLYFVRDPSRIDPRSRELLTVFVD